MSHKERFIELLTSTKRNGIEKVIAWLEQHNFFTDPASSNHHGNYEGGLVEHSLNVYDELVKLLPPPADEKVAATVIIVALLHDTCKAGTYKKDTKNVKDDKGQWTKVPYFAYNPDGYPFGHGEKSVIILQTMIRLSIEEALAIRWHMGAYDAKENWGALGEAQALFPLVTYLHFADVLASRGEAKDGN